MVKHGKNAAFICTSLLHSRYICLSELFENLTASKI
jgi:hypothetical protein